MIFEVGHQGYKGRLTHGMFGTPIYRVWANMIQRCTNPKHENFDRYGGRGISVCERWREFEAFFADVGDVPEGKTFDRRDNDGNYEPDNWRWTDQSTQVRNSSRCVLVTLDNVTRPRIEWCELRGIPESVVRRRVNGLGWSVERALSTPVMTRGQGSDGRFKWQGM